MCQIVNWSAVPGFISDFRKWTKDRRRDGPGFWQSLFPTRPSIGPTLSKKEIGEAFSFTLHKHLISDYKSNPGVTDAKV